jgi:hypothetical protein
MALFFSYFCRSFVVSVFLSVSFLFFVVVQATERDGTWSEKRKKIEKKYSNILFYIKGVFLLAQQRTPWRQT